MAEREPAMELDERALERIGDYVRSNLRTWMREASPSLEAVEVGLHERIVRVEEELRAQRELMKHGFEQIDKRFEQVDKRFEQVDRRFEQVDRRFEQVERRFEQVDKRFEQVDKRFEQVNKRFEASERRLEDMIKALHRFMYWSFGFIATAAGIVIAAIRFL